MVGLGDRKPLMILHAHLRPVGDCIREGDGRA
jgi:hypothetical protein